jgi:hypothetical protein
MNASAVTSPTGHQAPPQPMRRWRVWMVYVVLFAIVAGHLVEVVTQREHWPFSPYQMWSIASTSWDVTHYDLRGVTAESNPREIDLYESQYLYPLPSRFMNLHLIEAAKDAEKGKTAKQAMVARETLKHYEQRRQAKQHDGPPLQAIRLYRFDWKMNKDATNAKQPDRVTLLYDSADPTAARRAAEQNKTPPGQEAGRDGSE